MGKNQFDEKKPEWVSLHQHTEYSLLDSSAKISDLIKRAKEFGMKSIAITDHGVMYGCVDFYKEAIKQGIKPIIGCEIYVASKSMYIKQQDKENETHHLVLLVKNEIGYKNLMEIVSKASVEGFYYKPRVDHEFLKDHSEGLIALSACLGGEVQANILKENLEKAEEVALIYKDIFKEGFYLELQYHGMEEQLKVNETLVKMSKDLDIPLVATNDVHYIRKEDYKSHDILLCIQTGKTVEEENRMRYPSDQFYLKSPEEMYETFSYVPEALENTVKISEECNFDYNFHESKLPKFPLEEGVDPYEYLREICFKGLFLRYEVLKDFIDKPFSIDEVLVYGDENKEAFDLIERLNYELSIIQQMGYVDYFLIVWDFIRFANEKGIMTGPGRGSAAGSLVAYTLGITKIDPIKYNLIFERFLNPDRISMPDIDSDFCYERRGEVIDYVVEKYGKENVSQIITFGTMAARACIRDVGRAMNYPYAEVDRIAKMIPTVLNITINKALELNPELKEVYDNEERVRELIDVARALEGLPRHTSTHAAGVVIASQPLVNYVPLQRNEESIVTQFTMGTLEELGLLKMDFLGLRTLTVMRDAVRIIKENKEINIDLDNIDFEDKEVYKMIGQGKTVGVFQLESAGMTSFMKELKPDSLEDIIAGISLYRPGPMAEIPRYIANKNNPLNIEYQTEKLEPILSVTYNCIVYQEQVMQIVRDLAGYSMGRSDLVRRAMSKKKHDVMEQERRNFIYGNEDQGVKGCINNGIDENVANSLFDSMMDFASYAFNKSHAAAYAVVGFQTAYLIRYYPTEFIAAMLNSVKGDNDKVSFYVNFAKTLGIEIIAPNINESYSNFTVKDNRIIFGLTAVKNVGEKGIDNIVLSREQKDKFIDLSDFFNKVDTSIINKRLVESLIKAGAFDCLKVYRSKMLAVFEKIMDGIQKQKRNNIEGQVNLFMDIMDNKESSIDIKYPNIKEFDKKYILQMEKEMTGLYFSGHPLEEYEETLKIQTSHLISDIIPKESLEGNLVDTISSIKDGDKVVVGGMITHVSKKLTRNNDMMAFIVLEDLYSSIEVIVFPKIFNMARNIINEDEVVLLKGRVSLREDEQPKLICEFMEPLVKINSEKLYILVEEKKDIKLKLQEIKGVFLQHKGNIPVYFCTNKERKKFRIDRELWVNGSRELMDNLRNMFGEDNVKIL
ncbi:DNA polymerase III subunit alpha [Clostridium botulinum]|uniref:DNA polymerase III subunit alpha n=1 Tax=Clostridium botulinum (strain Hall / ATCC 3502 / NCTC 13319 / Type A) TaxID=441771 RepID=A5I799_CLOBH|nr:DNA polymerase III subunit alpha [Clostridium botulinum]ABS32438.1 DNA polymerase III, alpha subunit [Clostridium botulinum A str. ATCC 19397]ABS36662.1 DNA polymerase III, alpha subunit [Clostridium botulinum A str. Hall]AWB19179.1 DNA polymerase III subunit alpha [Clostridium botulinum]AWB31992.1 DNA polymerase III subunit alpha [Clostridium botulinum]EGT5615618.1 DNA polymerase III subunit alpha [Clostridium botulinum]